MTGNAQRDIEWHWLAWSFSGSLQELPAWLVAVGVRNWTAATYGPSSC